MAINVPRVALVTGGMGGLGEAICIKLAALGYKVVTTHSPGNTRTQEWLDSMNKMGYGFRAYPCDVADWESCVACAQKVSVEVGPIDVLVNNAGIYLEGGYVDDRPPESVFDESIDKVRVTMETNLYGPYQLCQALIPLMREGGYGRVVNVSSRSGQLSGMGGREAAYRMSKAALNALTRILAAELPGGQVLVNSMSPGWVRSDMGGPKAPKTLAEGADTAVWLATLPKRGPHGGFFRERKPIPW